MNPPPFNTFVARGTLERIISSVEGGFFDENITILHVNITDSLDHRKNKVPFIVNKERRPLPDCIEVGDYLEIQFRLGYFKFAKGARGAKLKVGRITILGKWDETATETEAQTQTVAEPQNPAEDEIDELVRHLNEIKKSKTGKGISR